MANDRHHEARDDALWVRFPALSELSFTYKSAEEAIAASGHHERQLRAKENAQLIAGAWIKEIWWTEQAVTFVLSNGRGLRVYLRDVFTEWQVLDGVALQRPDNQISLESAPLALRVHGRQRTYTVEWRAGEMLAARLGMRMRNLYAGHVWLHVYFETGKLLTFLARERVADDSLFLQWREDD